MATRMLSHGEIEIGGGTQARSEINYFVVNEYAEHYRNGVEFPPLVVYDDGAKKWLSRGFHRYHASKDAGVAKVPCEVRKGSKRDAVWDAIADNQTHGLRRTNADKRRAVEMALKDKEWAAMSNRAVAEHVGVDESSVRKTRDELEQLRENRSSQKEETRTGRDGKKRKLPKKRRAKPKQPYPPEPDEGDDEQEESEPRTDISRVRLALAELEEACIEAGVDCDKEIAAIRMKLMKAAA